MAQVEVTSADAVEVEVGDEVVIRLPENASTGYIWSVRELGDGLELVSDETEPPGPERGIGAGGERVIRLRAVAPGTAEVVLEHGRPWESEPDEHRRLQVTVR